MQSETRRHLTTAYFLVAAFLLFSLPLGVPKAFVLWFTDPVARVLAFAVLVLFVPAAFFILFAMWALSVFIAAIWLALKVIIWIETWLAGLSDVGGIVSLLLGVSMLWFGAKFLNESGFVKSAEEQIHEVGIMFRRVGELFVWLVKGIVEFVAWLSVVMGRRRNTAVRNAVIDVGVKPPPPPAQLMEENMAQSGALGSIQAGMVELVQDHRELPVAPTAFNRAAYEGWFLEARKRFQLQTHLRTNAERINVLKQIHELQMQWFLIRKTEAEWQRFPQEEELQRLRLEIEKLELELKKEELIERRNKTKEPPPPPPAPPQARSVAQEFEGRQAKKMADMAEVMAAAERLMKQHPKLADQIARDRDKKLMDLRNQS